MNKLSYGLLSFLSTYPQTGYDLMIRLNQFWHTNHSAIYPLLSELEEKGYVKHTLKEQQGKPDKKIYCITEYGIKTLKEWLMSTTEDAVIKDESMLKIYCFGILDKEIVEKILDEIEFNATNHLNKYVAALENFKGMDCPLNMQFFGAYLLVQKAISDAKLKVKWCQWVRSLYTEDGNLFDNKFMDFLDLF